MYPTVNDDPAPLRLSTLAIGTSFDAAPVPIPTKGFNQLVLLCDLTLNTATDVLIRVDVACTNGTTAPATGSTEWHELALLDTAASVGAAGVETVPARVQEFQLLASGRYAIPLACAYKWIRVRAKTTGGPGSTTLGIKAIQGYA